MPLQARTVSTRRKLTSNNMVQFSAIIDGVNAKKDSTLTIRLGTQELNPHDTAEIFKFANKQIWVGLGETVITGLDIPKNVDKLDGQKSTSERLYAVLFVYWNTKTDKVQDFETFRKNYMEKIINNIKEKLD